MATSKKYVAPGWAPSGACALKAAIGPNTIFAFANFQTTSHTPKDASRNNTPKSPNIEIYNDNREGSERET